MIRSRWLCVVFAILAVSQGTASHAGVLATDPAAYIDGSSFQWHGSQPFSNVFGLVGYVDWAVYGPGDFPVAFTGYTPTAGELTYAYQVFVTGRLELSSAAVAIDVPYQADNIGTFSGGGVGGDAPLGMSFSGAPDSADWEFAGITPPGSSQGLAFSSHKIPREYFGSVIDGGTFAFVVPLPSPSPIDLPEPTSIALLGFGAIGLLYARRRMTKQLA